MNLEERAYVAALLDTMGNFNIRKTADGVELPEITISTPNKQLHKYLQEMTGARAFKIVRTYHRANCKDHCTEKHAEVKAKSLRWQVTGARATMLINDTVEFMRFKRDEAEELLNLGVNAAHKQSTVVKMASLGWSIPEMWQHAEVTAQ
jgi:hypothetical protein